MTQVQSLFRELDLPCHNAELHPLPKYLAGFNEGRSGAAKYKKKKKKSILIKIKPKERKDMVVLQIYILGFPIDLKKKKEFHKTVILLSGICRGFL